MPCRVFYDDHPEDYFRDVTEPKLKAQISFAESALCGALTALTRLGFDALDQIAYGDIGIKKSELKMWWEEHKKLDEKHRQQELKLSALAKLTDEERKALGLE